MGKWVSSAEKRSFLKWFLESHRLKNIDARRVIEIIINNQHIIENISFTDQLKTNTKTIVISSMNSDEVGFEFYLYGRKYYDVSKAVNELWLNPSDRVFIILHFYGKMNNHRYLQLIETPVKANIKRYQQYKNNERETNEIIEKIMHEKNIELIKKQIDLALDHKDEFLFHTLANRLKELEDSKKNESE